MFKKKTEKIGKTKSTIQNQEAFIDHILLRTELHVMSFFNVNTEKKKDKMHANKRTSLNIYAFKYS